MSIIKRKAGSEDIVKSILEFDAVPTEGSPNLVESGAVAQAIGNLGQPLQWKGPATVAQLNTGITGIQPGWTYTLTDAGTLTDGSVDVEVGDEVAWTEDGEWFQVGPSLVELKADVAQAKSDIADIQDVVPEEASDSNKLVTKDELDNVQESIQSGFTPKGEISVSDLNDLTTQSNGDQYILTDSGTITDGSVTVEAGDSVSWNSTDSVWYKVNQYALSKYGTDEIKNLPTTITAFRTGDVIPVDGPSGTAKMDKNSLLKETSHSAIASNVVETFSDTKNYFNGNFVEYEGKTYQFKVDHPAGAWASADVNQVGVSVILLQILKSFSKGEFNATTNYSAGDFVWYRGYLWQFNVDHSAGAWVESECTTYVSGANPFGYLDRILAMLADSFSKNGSFECGDIVWTKGLMYLTGFTYTGDITSGGQRAPTYKLVDNSVAEIIVKNFYEHKYVNASGAFTADSNFNVYEYDITGYKTLNIFSAPGGGYHAFYDSNNDIVGSVFRRDDTAAGCRTQCCFYKVVIPSGAVTLRVTNTCKRDKYITYDSKPRVYSYNGSVGLELYKLKRAIDSVSSNSPFIGKKILAIGDSITDSAKWFPKLLELSGASKIWNRGVSGTLVAGSGTYSFVNRLDLPTSNTDTKTAGFPDNDNVDAVILWGGTNDWGSSQQTPFGSVSGAISKDDFCGAFRYMIEGLKQKYQGKPLFVLSVMNSQGASFPNWARLNLNVDGSFTYRTNPLGKTMSDYWLAQKEICQLYGVKFIDMFECGISPIDPTDAANYFGDGLHPNDAGAEIIAQYIYKNMT